MRTWKVLGLAGLASVAATGAVIARDARRRQDITPDDVRERLRARHAAATAPDPAADALLPAVDVDTSGPSRWHRLTRRLGR